jgi:hypothetical protein
MELRISKSYGRSLTNVILVYNVVDLENNNKSSFSYPHPTKWGCGKDSAIIFKIGLTSTLLETGVGANDYKCSRERLNEQLNVSSEARRSSK